MSRLNPVKKKILYYVDVIADSPVCVSNGDDGMTDRDVIRDYDGKPFVPGASLAGAFRNYLYTEENRKNTIFGYTSADGMDGRMSSIYISDMEFTSEDINVDVRDGVALGDNKVALSKAKFDYEVVDTGTEARFIIELVEREQSDVKDAEAQIMRILRGIDVHEIRFGSKKSRGYGTFHINWKDGNGVKRIEFTKENYADYKYAYVYEKAGEFGNSMKLLSKEDIYAATGINNQYKYIRINVPIRLTGGISIRKYSARKGGPDYEHITVNNGKAVIPGTSMCGAIRHRMKRIMTEAGVDNVDSKLEAAFGSERENAHISNIFIDESILNGAKEHVYTRNAISRFEQATRRGALYKEGSYYGGDTTLTMFVRDSMTLDGEDITGEIMAFILAAIEDLIRGYLAVGGQTSIGRGLLEPKDDKKITIIEPDGTEKQVSDFLNIL